MMSKASARNSYVATHPEAVALRAGNEALREELVKLISDRDYLIRAATFYDQETAKVNDE